MTTVVTQEMGFTHKQLLRLLPRAAADRPYQLSDTQFVIDAGNSRTVTVVLEPETVRKIASVSLPQTTVHFEFSGFDYGEAEAEMDRLSIHFHKGGG
ncbi:MAG TPA: hypothetical protein EYQ81_07485 [Sneathiellales bacterium]|nr:hypothetical protein [Sneathiellales bacterium]